ncbi:MAG: four helix bundle protein [Alphaproteobacteria bacterium]|nr:four helix bundle protein [Alphaproteobacteria bacterium]
MMTTPNPPEFAFSHEVLDVYRLAREVALWIRGLEFPRGEAELRNQALRASSSVVLNIAEGRARGGRPGQNHYRIALGSAAELCAVMDLLRVDEALVMQRKLRRVGAMLNRMSR